MCQLSESSPVIVEISWDCLCSEFARKFKEVFDNSDSRKLHFSDSTKIDGASMAWIELSLLDAIVQFDGDSHPASKRRLFNQKAIIESLVYQQVKDALEKVEISLTASPNAVVILNRLSEWTNYETLKTHMMLLRFSRKKIVTEKFASQIDRLYELLSQRGSLAQNIEHMITTVLLSADLSA